MLVKIWKIGFLCLKFDCRVVGFKLSTFLLFNELNSLNTLQVCISYYSNDFSGFKAIHAIASRFFQIVFFHFWIMPNAFSQNVTRNHFLSRTTRPHHFCFFSVLLPLIMNLNLNFIRFCSLNNNYKMRKCTQIQGNK